MHDHAAAMLIQSVAIERSEYMVLPCFRANMHVRVHLAHDTILLPIKDLISTYLNPKLSCHTLSMSYI